jgi:hypothetical protein
MNIYERHDNVFLIVFIICPLYLEKDYLNHFGLYKSLNRCTLLFYYIVQGNIKSNSKCNVFSG